MLSEAKDIPRLRAAVKSARRNHNANAILSLHGELLNIERDIKARHEQELDEVEYLLKIVKLPPAKFKDGFVLSPPDGYHAEAFKDDGWILSYVNPETDDIIEISTWPFDQAYVFGEDLESLGFKVES